MLVAPDGSAIAGTLDATGRYPVGSGDAFLAGLVVARDERRRLGRRGPARPGRGRRQRGSARRRPLDRGEAERLAGLAAVSSV